VFDAVRSVRRACTPCSVVHDENKVCRVQPLKRITSRLSLSTNLAVLTIQLRGSVVQRAARVQGPVGYGQDHVLLENLALVDLLCAGGA